MGWSGVGIEIDTRRLAVLDPADLAFGNEAAQINLVQIEQRDDGRAGGDDFAGFGGTGDDGAVEGRGDDQVAAILLGFRQLGARCGGRPRRWRFRAVCWAICLRIAADCAVRMLGLSSVDCAMVSAPWPLPAAPRGQPRRLLLSAVVRPACPGARKPRRFSRAACRRRGRTGRAGAEDCCWARSASAAASRLRLARRGLRHRASTGRSDSVCSN